MLIHLRIYQINMSNYSYRYDKDYQSILRFSLHSYDIGTDRDFRTGANGTQVTDFANKKDTHAALSTITTGISTGQSPLQFVPAIDTIHAHMGNRALMHHVGQQYQQQVHDIAQEGFRDSPQPFPFQDQIQQAFGEHHDISDLKAYTGTAAHAANARLGSRAFHRGGQVAFEGQPTLKEAAHEATHYVQHVRSDQLERGIGDVNDSYERHADRVADSVVRGQFAAPLLEQTLGNSDRSAPVASNAEAPVQMTGGNLLRRLAGLGQRPGSWDIQALLRRNYKQLSAGKRALIASAERPDPFTAEIFKRRTELRNFFRGASWDYPEPEDVERSMERFIQLAGKDGWAKTALGKIFLEINDLEQERKKLDLDAYGDFRKFEEQIKATHPGAWSYKDLFQGGKAEKAGFPPDTIRFEACPLAGGTKFPLWPKLYAHCIDVMWDAIRENPSAEDVHVNFDSLRTDRIAELIKNGNVSQFDEMPQWDISQLHGVTEWEFVRAVERLGSSRVHSYSYDKEEAKYKEFALDIPVQIPEVGTPGHEKLVEFFRNLSIRYAGHR